MVNWNDPVKKPVLSAQTSRMLGPSRMVYIPPLRLRFSLLGLPPEQVGKAEKPGSSSTIPLRCPKEMVVKVQEESPKGMAESKDRFRTMGRLTRTAPIAAEIYPAFQVH